MRPLAFVILSLLVASPAASSQEALTPKGQIQRWTYASAETGVDRTAWVYTPPGYSEARRYPVLYVLHGIGGTEREWLNNGDPGATLDRLIAAGQMPPALVVFANGRAMVPDSVPRELFAPEVVNAFARFEADLVDSLIPAFETAFSAVGDRRARGLCGLSMGGGQALNFGLGHPELFGAVGAFSAAPNTDTRRFLASKTGPAPTIYLVCGDSDNLWRVSQNAAAVLRSQGVEATFETIPGNHDWSVWWYGFEAFAVRAFR